MELRDLINCISNEFKNNNVYGNNLLGIRIIHLLSSEIIQKNLEYKNDFLYFEDVSKNKKYKWKHFYIVCNNEIYDPILFHQENFKNFHYTPIENEEYEEIPDELYNLKLYFFENLQNQDYYRMIHFLSFQVLQNILKYYNHLQYLPPCYTKILPNERCPCGSNKKFKKCIHQSSKL